MLWPEAREYNQVLDLIISLQTVKGMLSQDTYHSIHLAHDYVTPTPNEGASKFFLGE